MQDTKLVKEHSLHSIDQALLEAEGHQGIALDHGTDQALHLVPGRKVCDCFKLHWGLY